MSPIASLTEMYLKVDTRGVTVPLTAQSAEL